MVPHHKHDACSLHVRCPTSVAPVAVTGMTRLVTIVVTTVVTVGLASVMVWLPWSMWPCMAWLHVDPQHWPRVGWKLGLLVVGLLVLMRMFQATMAPRGTRIRRWKTCATRWRVWGDDFKFSLTCHTCAAHLASCCCCRCCCRCCCCCCLVLECGLKTEMVM